MALIVGIGGTIRPNSSTELALRRVLAAAEKAGAATRLYGGAELARLPHYAAGTAPLTEAEVEFVTTVRQADGLVIASPGYHGSISGLVKNAIDLLEETAKDARVYFDGMPVGLIVTAYGWQATGSTLAALRSIVHAMRGWPTPLGVAINSIGGAFDAEGNCKDPAMASQLDLVGRQVIEFVEARHLQNA
jgi:FMN reductase